MSYLVCHFGKYKSGNVFGMQRHNQRENENYSNIDIDKARTPLNYDLINQCNINYHEKIKTNIEANRASSRAVRKDATVYCECIISSDKNFFDKLDIKSEKIFFEQSLEYLKSKIGENNIISATVHLDETTPHMHLGFVPMIENSLSAKRLINRQFLREVQDQLPIHLKGAGFNIQRGEKDSKSKHIDIKRIKHNLQKDVLKLEQNKIKLENEIIIKINEHKSAITDLKNLDISRKEYNSEPLVFNKAQVKVNKNDFNELVKYREALFNSETLVRFKTILNENRENELNNLKREVANLKNNRVIFKEKIKQEVELKFKDKIEQLEDNNKKLEIDNKNLANSKNFYLGDFLKYKHRYLKNDKELDDVYYYLDKIGKEDECLEFVNEKREEREVELEMSKPKIKSKKKSYEMER